LPSTTRRTNALAVPLLRLQPEPDLAAATARSATGSASACAAAAIISPTAAHNSLRMLSSPHCVLCRAHRRNRRAQRQPDDREKLQERLAKLAGGVAVIRVGGATEIEVKERKDRVDDAMHATRAAVEEGVLPGGGVALLRASETLKKVRTHNDDQKTGVEIVRKALSWPARQIAINAGEDGSIVVGKILEKDTYAYGYDAQAGEYGNLISKGIIDPTKVVRAALQGAASVAGLLITTEAMVAELPKKQSPAMPGGPGGGMGGMGGMDF